MAEADSPTKGLRRLAGQRILVVDDERRLVALLVAALEAQGAEVLPAHDADEALGLMDRRPDLAIIDVRLGASKNGFELLEELRHESSIPVIMLTGLTDEQDVVRALSLGADDYVRKPFSTIELIARLEARLRRASPELQ